MDSSAGFPKRISGAVHLIGIQPYKQASKQAASKLFYIPGLKVINNLIESLFRRESTFHNYNVFHLYFQ